MFFSHFLIFYYKFTVIKELDLSNPKKLNMKNLFILFTIATLALMSCREQKTETKEIIREVRVETTDKTETPDREGILERTAKKVDDEVNKEIDQEIKKIGDDN